MNSHASSPPGKILMIFLFLSATQFYAVRVLAENPEIVVTIKNIVTGYSSDQRFVNPQGIFYDKRFKETYVCDAGNHQVVIFDSTGFPVYRFKHWIEREGKRMLGEPRCLAVNSFGNIFLIDNLADYVDVLDHRGIPEDRIILAEILNLEEAKPTQLAIDDGDNLYLSFRNDNAELVVLDQDLNLKMHLVNQSENKQDFEDITGLWVDKDGKIYLTDATAEPCLKVFSKQGEYLSGFGKHDVGWDGFSFPAGVVTSTEGVIWVVDTFRQVVKAFSFSGEYLRYIGGYGGQAGEMKYPGGISGDGDSLMIVVEKVGERYQLFQMSQAPVP